MWLRNSITMVLVGAFSFLQLGCDQGNASDGPIPTEAWLTEGQGQARLKEQTVGGFRIGAPDDGITIEVDPGQTFQEIEGFGAALTNAAAYVIHHADKRDEVLERLFSPDDGIGISYVRLPMGSSDFTAQPHYTYDDVPAGETDPELTSFSIDPDRPFILPVLKDARALQPSLHLMATPWSAPAWMKAPAHLNGGSLQPQYHDAYAQYFVRFLQAYQAEGITFDALTPQNEPHHATDGYPSMRMTATQQAAFIGDALGPALDEAGFSPKILAWDHNWDEPDYPRTVLQDAEAHAYVDGIAWHCYGGDVSAQSQVHQAFPEVDTYFTECSGGEWDTNFGNVLTWNMRNLFIGGTRNWAKAVLLWNLALDDTHGPARGGCDNCRGVVTIARSGDVRYEPEYYVIGHFSKYVKPGARRIASTSLTNQLETVAFRNPDGSFVLVALNPTSSPQAFSIQWGDRSMRYGRLPGQSVVTVRWREAG